MSNFYVLVNLLNQSSEFDKLDIKENKIGYNGQYLDFSYFDYYDFYSKNTNFKNNLSNLNAESVFKILEIHAKFYDFRRF